MQYIAYRYTYWLIAAVDILVEMTTKIHKQYYTYYFTGKSI